MEKLNKDFFKSKEVLFIGDFDKYLMFSEMAVKAFTESNIAVYPVHKSENKYSFKVYKDFSELPKMPDSAYTILDTEDNKNILEQLQKKGIKKLLFHSKRIFDQEIENKCKELGIETAYSCPLMLYGKGLHRFHGFLSGIKTK
jgi:hypothetical protein